MISLQCVKAFSPAQPGEEQNHKGYGPQSGQYLHSWGGVVTFVLSMASKEDGESSGFLSIKKKKKKGFLFVFPGCLGSFLLVVYTSRGSQLLR